jgi:hypothetical protein
MITNYIKKVIHYFLIYVSVRCRDRDNFSLSRRQTDNKLSEAKTYADTRVINKWEPN